MLLTSLPLYPRPNCHLPYGFKLSNPGIARLACLIYAASVHSEPGSNSPKKFEKLCIMALMIYLLFCYLLWIDLVNLAKDLRRPKVVLPTNLLMCNATRLAYFNYQKNVPRLNLNGGYAASAAINKKRPDSCRDVSKFTKLVLMPFLFTTKNCQYRS